MTEGDDVSRLRALLEMMREGGLTRLALPDGTVLERPPPSPLEVAMRRPARLIDDEDRDEIAEEEAEEKDLSRRWRAHWERATASSGAEIPAFPGPEQAMRFFGGRQ